MDYKYTGDDFDIKKAPTKVKDSANKLDGIKKQIEENLHHIRHAQKMMYARHKYGILVVFQALDAAGKDSMIAHIFSGVDPIGFKVANFEQPTSTELRHDYLWRINEELPSRGEIGVFNRSYYEDVLVSRVHPEIVLNADLPGIDSLSDVDSHFFNERYHDIRDYERYLSRNGFVIFKFFLHISKEEQKKRFLRRINLPKKHWKFSSSDIRERQYWDQYQKAYEKAINATATKKNPWYVVPADDKWYSRLIVSDILTKEIEKLPLAYPKLSSEEAAKLDSAKEELLNEK
ncbi:PPK2 family polyphosphate kinase [Limosilactobacillus fastidiosus]|uniref:Polyphosphate kinase 2 family protein n=1 Tax=Limosilactobacillus fastidiosus TaxID=2759855 RepID=A0A7W3TZK7_9LACO|nr:PPK2 family polyphosphate kinase [Limosilactobacillus fastidiosus]MBB1063113.1 polyphosphate kinase 2 family protein [Limosilactobacillus fastidiosus]MBB1086182.1 polyphosphate kinase 2 family protein [Limosilactobacillus fastidiosus]MCD7084128.1 polyphosphate kinase 2 family protein [Limosilactobacillus fastidiosus]MCD7086489.1 polyphosphate kinase 2 family protein [Limosilactobacillus fastidiosus]MCD7114641.1 polyphosphate kinase 2 family protein [Limosilactobacillus fastidiosus]